MKQLWFCEVCQKAGVVEFDDHAGVWEGFMAVADAHVAAEPECPNDAYHIRVPRTLDDMPLWASKAVTVATHASAEAEGG